MAKFRVSIARSQREYAEVIVEAESVEAASAEVEKVLDNATESQKTYCDLVNSVSWHCGDETFDEEVLSAEECEDDDEEVDVVVTKG